MKQEVLKYSFLNYTAVHILHKCSFWIPNHTPEISVGTIIFIRNES